MELEPMAFISLVILCSRLLTTARTPIIQNIPMVTPNNERKVRSLFFHNSCSAILKLLPMISSVRRIMKQIYRKLREEGKILFGRREVRGFGGPKSEVRSRRSEVRSQKEHPV